MAKTSDAKVTNVGFDWGDMAVERLFEHNGYRGVRIRSMATGRYVDVHISRTGRSMMRSSVLKDARLKGYDPCGSKKTF